MPPTDVDPPLLDPVAIEELRKVAGDQGTGFIAEMARLFEEETVKSLEEMRKACDEHDWKLVARIAHSLKSSAASLGLMRLSRACRDLEMDTRDASSGPETAALVASVLGQYDEATPVLKTLA